MGEKREDWKTVKAKIPANFDTDHCAARGDLWLPDGRNHGRYVNGRKKYPLPLQSTEEEEDKLFEDLRQAVKEPTDEEKAHRLQEEIAKVEAELQRRQQLEREIQEMEAMIAMAAAKDAMKEAHSNDAVLNIWQKYAQVCEYVPIGSLTESQNLFSEFSPLTYNK